MEFQLLKKREPFPLTDEEVIREALKAVTSYASRHTEEAFVLDDAVEWALAAVESVWRKARHYYSYRPLGIADRQELEELSARIRQELRARACKKAMEIDSVWLSPTPDVAMAQINAIKGFSKKAQKSRTSKPCLWVSPRRRLLNCLPTLILLSAYHILMSLTPTQR